jgi:hypothetical protein
LQQAATRESRIKKAGDSSTPGLKTSQKKGIRDVSLKVRRHRECEKADL